MRLLLNPKIIRLSLTWAALLAYGTSVQAVDKIEVVDGRDPRYLPYEIQIIVDMDLGLGRRRIDSPCHVYSLFTKSGDTASIVSAQNPPLNEDEAAQVSTREAFGSDIKSQEGNAWDITHDVGVALTITDLTVCPDTGRRGPAIMVVGYRRDSAFVVKLDPIADRRESLYLCSGSDGTGDGAWRPDMYFLAAVDYDYDGRTELFLYVNSLRERGPRALICLEPDSMRIRWICPVAAPVQPHCFFSCNDRKDPGVIFTTQDPANGKNDSHFSDENAYVSRIDRIGKVVFAKVIGTNFRSGTLLPADGDYFYLSHAQPIDTVTQTKFSSTGSAWLSKIDGYGRPISSQELRDEPRAMWSARYRGSTSRDLFAVFRDGMARVYDSCLNLVAEGEGIHHGTFQQSGLISWDHNSEVVVLNGQNTGIFTIDLRQLASAPGYYDLAQPVTFDSTGRLQTILFSAPNHWMVGQITRRSLLDYAAIAYLDYKNVILAGLLSLVVGLVVMNYYRVRARRNLAVISGQKNELEQVYSALRQAQARIVAQEKFRQAQDIAGGVAHEIHNALCPAINALEKLKKAALGDGNPPGYQTRNLIEVVEGSVQRGFDMTALVTSYSRLDVEQRDEEVDLFMVVKQVLEDNRLQLDEAGVQTEMSGTDGLTVVCLREHCYSLVSNLILNAVDALREVPRRELKVSSSRTQAGIELRIEDTGPGIPREDQARVFDLFYSTKPSTGSGVGLAMVKRICELYGARIAIDSQPGLGTKFTILWPHDNRGKF